jgi:hypothetical protein
MKFPTLVYRCPGNHQCLGGTFDYIQVSNAEQLKASVENGWFPTLPEAQKGELDNQIGIFALESSAKEPIIEEVDEDSPPTREELEAKAKELGIGFNKNTKDETLLEKIEAALDEE